jgi:hypothetical protein
MDERASLVIDSTMLEPDLIAALVTMAGSRAAARLARADTSLRRLVESAVGVMRRGAKGGLALYTGDEAVGEVLAVFPPSLADVTTQRLAIEFADRTLRECELAELLGWMAALHDASISSLGDDAVLVASHTVTFFDGSWVTLTQLPSGSHMFMISSAQDLPTDEGPRRDGVRTGAFFLDPVLRRGLVVWPDELPRGLEAWRAFCDAAPSDVRHFARELLARALPGSETGAAVREAVFYREQRRRAAAGWEFSDGVARREVRARLRRL